MRNRNLWIAATLVTLLAIVIIFGLRPRETDTSVASPTPVARASGTAAASAPATATATGTASAAASASAARAGGGSGVYNDAFGFVLGDNNGGASIRRESSGDRIATLASRGYAVSPDGTRIAYWTAATPQELKIVSAANPQSLVASSNLSANERGGDIVWSNDGRGVAYAVHTGDQPSASTVRVWDLSAGGPGKIVLSSTQAGAFYVPLAWDRTRTHLVAAGASGGGGFMTDYVTVDPDADGSTRTARLQAGQLVVSGVHASSDAAFLLAQDATGFLYWPIQSFTGGTHPLRGTDVANGKDGGASWRPGTHEIGFIVSGEFRLCDVDKDQGQQVTTCSRTVFATVPAGARVQAFRADGSAVVLATFLSSAPPAREQISYTLVNLTASERVTFTDVNGPIASVRIR